MQRLTCITSILLSVLLLSIHAYPQRAWHWQNPLPQGNHLNDIQAVTSNVGFASGNHGVFLKTVNAGTHWELLEFPRRIDIQQVHFVNESVGWVTGVKDSFAYLYWTNDGGITWINGMEIGSEYIAVFFLDENIGWVAVDSIILHTQNGGETWVELCRLGPITQILFHNTATGWMIGGSTVYRTTDGGSSWQSTVLEVYGLFSLQKIKFVKADIGWIIGSSTGPNHFSGHLLKTTDGGQTWKQQLEVGLDFVDYRTFTDIEFENEQLGWAISPGQVYQTTDGGAEWKLIVSVPYLTEIAAIDDSSLWGAGYYGALYTSADSGSNWEEQYVGTVAANADMWDLHIVNETTGFAGGGKTLLRTLNGGEIWEKIEIDVNDFGDSFVDILSVWFIDTLKGWMSIDRGWGWGGLFKTTDGGSNWTNQLDEVFRIWDIYFIDGIYGWCTSNKVYHTDDGGDFWTLQSEQAFDCLFFVNRDIGWGGGYGTMMKTTDGGDSWVEVLDVRESAGRITDIHFISPLEGWAVGYSGVYPNIGVISFIYKTTDGGITWDQQICPEKYYAQARSVYFIDRDRGWVVGTGYDGEILHTSNSGDLWELVDFPTDHDLYRIEFTGRLHGWILGDGGSILHTSYDITPTRGDVNGDGTIDILDVTKIVNHIIGLTILEGEMFNRADCNDDGEINVLDVVGIVNVILGRGTCEP